MHNTITEYKQMHNKIISWNDNWILIFICFMGILLLESSASLSSSFIVSYPNSRVDKKFFKSWDLHIPHWLRDLLWMVRAWFSVSPIFSSLLMSRASSYSSHEWIPWSWESIQGGHHHFYILHFFFYWFKLLLIWKTLMTAWSLHF